MKQSKHELTTDVVVLRIMEQLKQQGKTEKELELAIGLTNGAFGRWKYLNGKSYRMHIDKIADYLDVTKDFLLNESDSLIDMENMTAKELRLIQMYRKMNFKEQRFIFETAECFMHLKKQDCSQINTIDTMHKQ